MVRMDLSRLGGDGKSFAVGGRVALTLFLFFFFAMGSLFEVFLIREFGRTLGQRSWRKTPCTILAGEVQERDNGASYAFVVSYRYEHGGQTHEGSAYKRGYSGSDKYSDTQGLVQKYPAGMDAFCYVNPKDPAEAVLRRDSLLIGLAIFFPLIFVAIGAGGIYFVWRKSPPPEARPIAAAAHSGKGLGKFGLAALFAVFALVGGVLFYVLGIKPIARTIDAKSWTETPCKVLRAEVRSHESDDSTTYSVYILYQYQFDGQTHKSDRYDFIGGSSSGYQGKARTVALYEAASNPVCYVNPKNPSEAVLKRGFHAGLLLALFPLPFLLIGVGGLVHTVRGKAGAAAMSRGRAGRGGRVEQRWPIGPVAPTGPGPATLASSDPPKMKFIAMTLAAVFWNGIISIFVVGTINDLRHGGFSFHNLFLLPFVAVGLGLVAAAVYQFLAMFNPRPTLELSTGAIPLGGAAALRWSLSGQTSRISQLRVTLRGTEEAKYRRGTNTYTDRSAFYEMELCRTSDPLEIASGQVGFVVPQDTMHSFEAANNKVLWDLELHGDIKGWPDVRQSFRITVAPTIA